MATAETPNDDITTTTANIPLHVVILDGDEPAQKLSARLQRAVRVSARYRRRINIILKQRKFAQDQATIRLEQRDREFNRAANAIEAGRAHKATIKSLKAQNAILIEQITAHTETVLRDTNMIANLEVEIRDLEGTIVHYREVIDQQAARIKSLEAQLASLAPAIVHSANDNLG